MIYLGGIEEDYALWNTCKLNWIIKFGKQIDQFWQNLRGLRLLGPAPNALVQKGFADFMEKKSDSLNMVYNEESLVKLILENYKILHKNLDGF